MVQTLQIQVACSFRDNMDLTEIQLPSEHLMAQILRYLFDSILLKVLSCKETFKSHCHPGFSAGKLRASYNFKMMSENQIIDPQFKRFSVS